MNLYLRHLKSYAPFSILSVLLILVAFPISSLSHSYKPSSSGKEVQPVDVQIDVPPAVPLEILNVQVTPTPSGMSGMTYTLRNDDEQPLVAVEIKWRISQGTGNGLIEVNDVDAWTGRSGMLAPGANKMFHEGALRSSATPLAHAASVGDKILQEENLRSKEADPVTGLTGTITYAEFADGTRVGPDANSAVYQRLRADRLALKTAYQQLLGTYRTGGKEALLDAIHSIGTSAQTMAYREARLTLGDSLQKEGFDSMLQNLQRVAAQKVP